MVRKYLNRDFLGRFLTLIMFTTLSIAGFTFSIYLFILAVNLYDYVVAGSFMLLSMIAGFFNFSASLWYYRSYFYNEYLDKIRKGLKPLKSLPNVSIVVPVYNEDPQMVKKNLMLLKQMKYPKNRLHIYVLDDSSDVSIKESIEKSCRALGIGFIHRNDRKGYKAGALNNFIQNHPKGDYLAIFDADERLTNKNFLLDTLPFFQDEKLAYVQTEKMYAKGTFFSDSVRAFDSFFFEFVEPARALNNTAIFSGSCGIISRKALDAIGGFPEYVIEDTMFSFESDMHNFHSLYLPKVYALGRPIKKFTELVKQQWRYNYGDTQFIYYFIKKNGLKRMSPLSNMEYVTHGFGLNYLSLFLILFTIISIIMVFAALPFAHINFTNPFAASQVDITLELLGFFAFLLSLFTPVMLTKVYFNSFKKGLMIFLLNYSLAFVRAKAAIAATFSSSNPNMHWTKGKDIKTSLVSNLFNTKYEIAFASILFAIAVFALYRSNIAGGSWLIWYSALYLLAPVFLHRYG